MGSHMLCCTCTYMYIPMKFNFNSGCCAAALCVLAVVVLCSTVNSPQPVAAIPLASVLKRGKSRRASSSGMLEALNNRRKRREQQAATAADGHADRAASATPEPQGGIECELGIDGQCQQHKAVHKGLVSPLCGASLTLCCCLLSVVCCLLQPRVSPDHAPPVAPPAPSRHSSTQQLEARVAALEQQLAAATQAQVGTWGARARVHAVCWLASHMALPQTQLQEVLVAEVRRLGDAIASGACPASCVDLVGAVLNQVTDAESGSAAHSELARAQAAAQEVDEDEQDDARMAVRTIVCGLAVGKQFCTLSEVLKRVLCSSPEANHGCCNAIINAGGIKCSRNMW